MRITGLFLSRQFQVDSDKVSFAVQQAISSTGVGLNHVPAGVKDASDKKILVDMLLWAVDNPAPANFMLISGDRDLSNALHQLSMRRYTILLAQPPRASAPLIAAAKNVCLWTSLASGEILKSAFALAHDQYGNYVTQYVLERGESDERGKIIEKLTGNVVQMSQHKYASNVVKSWRSAKGDSGAENKDFDVIIISNLD
ncbi:hypothetical protein Bca52824_051101 [Brassica carinata]|uniref:NYN domain-containing protein n=1 Tax=Brassica carinata TaxID=52824 RepID=A0A8X7R147_BRACI|nr:hypothetical protein Bca52824_051101 [Brassica carinata]